MRGRVFILILVKRERKREKLIDPLRTGRKPHFYLNASREKERRSLLSIIPWHVFFFNLDDRPLRPSQKKKDSDN